MTCNRGIKGAGPDGTQGPLLTFDSPPQPPLFPPLWQAYGPEGRTASKLLLPGTKIEPPREMQPL